MRFTITTKQFHLSDLDQQYIEKNINKLLKFTPWKDPDFPNLDIILRNHKKRSRDHIEKMSISEDSVSTSHGHEKIDNPVYYDGTLDLILPKKRLVAKMVGKNVHDALKDGFDELLRELDKYKGIHFEGDSKYSDRRTIRQKK